MHATCCSNGYQVLKWIQGNCVVAWGMNFELFLEINIIMSDQLHAPVLLPPISVLYFIQVVVHLSISRKNWYKDGTETAFHI